MRRSLSIAVVVATLALATGGTAFAQSFFVNAGGVFNEQSAATRSTQSAIQLGSRVGLSSLFKVVGQLSLQSQASSAELGLQVYPLRGRSRVEPYAFLGYGRYLNGGIRKSVVPVGAGIAIHLRRHWGINVEVANRTSLLKDDSGIGTTLSELSPTIGVTYNLSGIVPQRRRPDTFMSEVAPESLMPAREIPSVDSGLSDNENVDPYFDDADPDVAARPAPASVGGMTQLRDGMFIMGLADEDPLSMQTAGFKRVTVAAFKLDKAEVTNAQYREYLSTLSGQQLAAMQPDTTVWHEAGFRFSWNAYFEGSAFDNHPVVALTYDQAKAYCSSMGKRLPTEAEWEYAARAGRAGGIYPWSGYEPRDGNGRYLANYNNGRSGYAADGYAFTAPVNAYKPNPWGFYNMSGNVAEWVEDAFSPTYSVLSDFNPFHEDDAEVLRVVRGGSWASDAFYIGVGVRDAQPKDQASPFVGVRCAQDVADVLANPARSVNRASIKEETPELQQN